MTEIEKELERFIASGKATTKVNSGGFQTTHIDPLKIAKYFAQWQREQMMKDAIDATSLNSDYPTRLELNTKLNNVNAMGEVKVIIIKE